MLGIYFMTLKCDWHLRCISVKPYTEIESHKKIVSSITLFKFARFVSWLTKTVSCVLKLVLFYEYNTKVKVAKSSPKEPSNIGLINGIWTLEIWASHGGTLKVVYTNRVERCYICNGVLSLRTMYAVRFDALTHWGRVTHICVFNLTTINSDNGLSPGRRQAIIWTNAGILLIGP